MAFAKTVEDAVSHALTDRRHADRSPVRREGWLRARDGTIHGVVVVDISSGGAGLALLGSHPFDADDRVELSLDMESPADEAWLPCVVRWRAGGRIGVAFRAVPSSVIARVLLCCARHK